jgi:hypothetical protein
MRGYDPAVFEAFFTAIIAAAAALTGLLFVAISINLDKIVKDEKTLSTRAAEALATLLLVVVTSAVALIPQSTRLMGLEILILALPILGLTVSKQVIQRRQRSSDPLYWTISRALSIGAGTIPCTIAGFSLAFHAGGGFYWLASAGLLGIVGAVYNAWVLLIEIIR